MSSPIIVTRRYLQGSPRIDSGRLLDMSEINTDRPEKVILREKDIWKAYSRGRKESKKRWSSKY
jgi:hypothetical protein